MTIPFIAALLLFGSLTAAQDNYISNFQVSYKNSTHITFSWDIVDGYYTSSYISSFRLYYQRRSSSYAPSMGISYSSATRSGATFSYTSPLETFKDGPYIMWVRAFRRSLDPRHTYSGKKHVKTGLVDTVLELKVQLHPTQNCSDFLVRLNSLRYGTRREVEWIIQKNCQCSLPYEFSVEDGYFICTASDYAIFRAKLSLSDSWNETDLASVKSNLSNLLSRQDRMTYITIDDGRYFIEPGPCGLTVPQLNSPHCLDSAPTQQAVASTSLQDSDVTTIVAIMSVSLAVVVLGGCIVYLVIGLRIMNHRRTKTAEVKATRNLEITSEGRSRNIPLSHSEDYAYASSDIPFQRNPR